jgi:hypothetical protein
MAAFFTAAGSLPPAGLTNAGGTINILSVLSGGGLQEANGKNLLARPDGLP